MSRYVIGMSQEVGDRPAIAFAIGFYRAIAAGRTVPSAFQFGLVELKMYSIPEDSTPVLVRGVRRGRIPDSEVHCKQTAIKVHWPDAFAS